MLKLIYRRLYNKHLNVYFMHMIKYIKRMSFVETSLEHLLC